MKSFLAILAGVAFLSFSGCQSGSKEITKETEIAILYPNWAEGIAFTHLAQAALPDKGYNVKVTPLEPGPIYASLAKGDADVMMDAWLPHTHSDYWEKLLVSEVVPEFIVIQIRLLKNMVWILSKSHQADLLCWLHLSAHTTGMSQ